MNSKTAWRPFFGALALLAVIVPAASAQKPSSDNYDDIYRRYLGSARATERPDASIAWMSGLASDPRARGLNDLVTVRVIESISAAGTADSSLSKKGAGSASVTKMFGLEDKLPGFIDPTALAGLSSETSFEGGGTTVRTGELSAVMTARVAEVLPNGDLVLEGAREIDINGDRQIVVLTGVVRPVDITPNNVVLSTQIGQLRIRYFGRGLIKDNLKPGWLIRILNKIF
jgi:flagellar L-ring protein precursor FlgH